MLTEEGGGNWKGPQGELSRGRSKMSGGICPLCRGNVWLPDVCVVQYQVAVQFIFLQK